MKGLKITLLLLCVSLTIGCSALAPLAKDALLGASKDGVEANANISKGDAEGDDSVAQNANTAVSVDAGKEQTETFNAPVETVINEAGVDWWVLGLLILLAGWAIPSPGEMGHGLVSFIRALRGTNQQ